MGNRVIPSQDIPSLRINDDTIKFREWLYSQSSDVDYKTVSQEYVESLRPKYGFTGSKWFRPVRIATFFTVGSAVGSLIGDQTMTTGLISSLASEVFSSYIDQYILEGIISGWKPQNFIENTIRPYTNI